MCEITGDPCPDDGLFCNGVESCNEGTDSCENDGDPCPDDGLFCNGVETCNEFLDQCVSSGEPCNDMNPCTDDACNEAADTCEHDCTADQWTDLCCFNDACSTDPVCVLPGNCNDPDRDGFGIPADPDCFHPVHPDCMDDRSQDAPICDTCTCGFDPACAGCARCIHPFANEYAGDEYDTNCNGELDCFIATASFGTEMMGKIDVLREFRDRVLLTSESGTDLVNAYYRISPPIADFIRERPALRTLVRTLLLPVVGLVNLLL